MQHVVCFPAWDSSKPFSRDGESRNAGLLTPGFGLSCNYRLLKGSVILIYLLWHSKCFNH